MNWKKLSKDEAEELSERWEAMHIVDLMDAWEQYKAEIPPEYSKMKDSLSGFYDDSKRLAPDGSNEQYLIDLGFALNAYAYLSKLGFTSNKASDDDVWRYIQMRVVPEIIFDRWGSLESKPRISAERLWKNPRRIWLKSLWWYVHLSLCDGSLEKTREILSGNTSDTIVQILERPGSGYRVELCRAIMKRYSMSPKRSDDLLRKVMKLNTARCANVEPLLIEEGLDGYVDDLFRFFEA